MKNKEVQIQKSINAQNRELVIKIGKEYTKENLDYMSKNSDYTPKRVAETISKHHISNGVLRSAFERRIRKYV